jgi:hypothetical protein
VRKKKRTKQKPNKQVCGKCVFFERPKQGAKRQEWSCKLGPDLPYGLCKHYDRKRWSFFNKEMSSGQRT